MYKLIDILKNDMQKWENKEFVFEKCDGKFVPTTCGKLIKDAMALAQIWSTQGLKGKRFAIYSENSVNYMTVDLAIMTCLGMSMGICKDWKYDDVYSIVSKYNIDVLVYSPSKIEVVEKLMEHLPKVRYISLSEISLYLEKGYQLIEENGLFSLPERGIDEIAKVVFSSGTTSFPKAVALSQKNIFAGHDSLQRRAPLNETDKCYLFLPLHHTYANIYNFLLSLINGMQIYLSSGTENIVAELSEVKPTTFCVVPIILKRMYQAVGEDASKLSTVFGGNLKYLFSGGAKLENDLKRVYKQVGMPLMEAYALSETASSFAIEYPDSEYLESVGTIFEDLDVKIDLPDENGCGEIICKGDAVFEYYLDNPEETKKVFDKEGYFHTGDLGFINENKLYIQGRKKKIMVLQNGEKISPLNLEAKLKSKNENISFVKIYCENYRLRAEIYVYENLNIDYKKIIDEFNNEVLKYERINVFNVIIDTIDNRLKQ